jgi:hypothetical protein
MFYIYSIILFFLASVGCIFLRHIAPTEDWQTAALVFQIIFTAVYIIFFISGFFHHLNHFHGMKRSLNEYKRNKKDLANKQEKLEDLKKYYEDYLAKLYPEIEKEIFNKIADNQPKELVALFQQYPDLKSSVVLKKLTKKVTELYKEVYSSKESVNWRISEIQNSQTNPWILWTPKLPADIEKEINS